MSRIVWSREEWQSRMQAHMTRVAAHADAFVDRRSRAVKHPVHDFLFTYYSFPPAKLKQWVPPTGVEIEIIKDDLQSCPWLQSPRFVREDARLRLDVRRFGQREHQLAAWVATLCRSIFSRAGRFTCFGLHEWAMVYRQSVEEIRHQGWELRLSAAELAAFVESQAVCCSHYDAFRFFTPEARLRNLLQPSLDSRVDLEQAACLHANMDLYKWASKLWPWTGSDLIGECFGLAMEGRDLDMRASPYDLSGLGCTPVKIETPEGREQYGREQKVLAMKAAVLRQHLLECCEGLTAPPRISSTSSP